MPDGKPKSAVPIQVLDRAEWLATILEHTADVICIVDLEGTILYVNRVVPGLSVPELIGRKAIELLAEESRAAWSEALRRAVAEDCKGRATGSLQRRTAPAPSSCFCASRAPLPCSCSTW